MPIDVVMFDLGGVVCRFRSEARLAALGAACGVDPDVVRRSLFDSGFDDAADRGEHDEAAVLDRVRGLGFQGGVAELRAAWATAFEPDPEVLELVARARRGRRTALLTDNGPVLLAALPEHLPSVASGFDLLFFTCVLGATKADPEAFSRALERAATPPDRAFFVDDSARNVATASALGIHAHHYQDAASLDAALDAALADAPTRHDDVG